MEKELRFRIIRIIFVLTYLVFASILWKNAYDNNVNAKGYLDSVSSTHFVELSDGINLTNAYPVSDEIGSTNESYKFKIVNDDSSTKPITIIALNNLDNDYISFDNIRYQVIKNNEIFIESNTLNNEGIMFNDIVNDENTYEIKFWIDNNANMYDILDKSFSVKISVL